MKKSLIISVASVLASISIIGCNSKDKGFSSELLTATIKEDVQLYDKFNESNFEFKYNGIPLDKAQYFVDTSNFDTSSLGETSFKLSLAIRQEISITVPVTVNYRKKLNFLSIGDSYGSDLIHFAELISSNSDETLDYHFYSLESADASLKNHSLNFFSDNAAYLLREYQNDTSTWLEADNKTIKEVINEKNINVISIQESANHIHEKSGYELLNNLSLGIANHIKTMFGYTPVITFHQVWAYQNNIQIDNTYFEEFNNNQTTMYETITNMSREYEDDIDVIIPCGTAVQNARSSTIVTDRDFTSNGRNIDERVGRYLLSLTLLSKLSGYTPSHFNYLGEATISEEEKAILDICVNKAIENPHQTSSLSE